MEVPSVAAQKILLDLADGWHPYRGGPSSRWTLLPLAKPTGSKPKSELLLDPMAVEEIFALGLVELIGPNDTAFRLTQLGSQTVKEIA